MKDKQTKYPQLRFKGFTDPWEQRKLGGIMDVTSVKRIHQSDWTNKGVRFFRARDIVALSKREKIQDPLFISEQKYNEYSKSSGKVRVDDLLVTGVGSIGIPYLVKSTKPLYFKDGNIIWFKNNGYLNGSFLYYSFIGNSIQNYIKKTSGSGTVGTFTIMSGKKTPILIPKSYKEQQKIGTFLQQLDHLITLHQRKLAKLKELKQGYLQKLFPQNGSKFPQLRFSGFADAWEQRKLGEISSITSGGTPKRDVAEYWNGNIPWVTTAEVNYQLIVDTAEKITSNGMASSAAKMIPKGSIVMAMYGQGKTRGQVGILGIDAATNQANANITVHNSSLTKIVYYQLESNYSRIRRLANEGGQANLSLGIVSNLAISITHDDEAAKIAKVLDNISQTIALHQRKLEKLKELKRGYLQNIFC